jgi:hypothetical protein
MGFSETERDLIRKYKTVAEGEELGIAKMKYRQEKLEIIANIIHPGYLLASDKGHACNVCTDAGEKAERIIKEIESWEAKKMHKGNDYSDPPPYWKFAPECKDREGNVNSPYDKIKELEATVIKLVRDVSRLEELVDNLTHSKIVGYQIIYNNAAFWSLEKAKQEMKGLLGVRIVEVREIE